MHRRGPIFSAIMFVIFAVMFSVIFWPEVSIAAKLAFFATGVGFGAAIARSVQRNS